MLCGAAYMLIEREKIRRILVYFYFAIKNLWGENGGNMGFNSVFDGLGGKLVCVCAFREILYRD